ncbi:Gfo/Idh/MocA family protein [Streptomyces sp. NPDC058052]|uniref:Gfo/Idh/MocA family protein n=1 Tax=Streptomyces sp. NPDC058052 TaxID=3346316 RepID=UPI0036EA4939
MDVNVGLVGFGVAGRQHAAALAGATGFRVTAVVEADPSLTTGSLRRLPSWERLLADPAVDLVGLCLPPGGRSDMALEALRAGKAVLLETPPALCEREVDLMVATAEAVGTPIGVMLQHRHRLADAVASADWSDPALAGTLEVSRFQPPAPFRRTGWRSEPTAAQGGTAAHLAVHYLDLACQLLGNPSGLCVAPRGERSRGAGARATGVVEFDSGATLSFTATTEAAASSERLRVFGPDRALSVDNGRVSSLIGDAERVWPTLWGAALRRLVYQDMAEAMRAGRQPCRSHLASARPVTRILQALHA